MIDEAWRLYHETKDDCVVRPSVPILFFGDYRLYHESPLKIVTVALNPSRHEFPQHDPFMRFRMADGVGTTSMTLAHREAYVAALAGYFRNHPYKAWFGWFDEVLRGMGASYYEGPATIALHTDLCSPLATDPTWSGLSGQRDRLLVDGMALWHRLVEHLEPDVIVVSVARHYRDRISFADPFGWQPLIMIPRADTTKRPYQAWAQRAALSSGKESLLVFGPAAQQPFATLSQEARQRVGRAALERLDAG